MRLAKKKVHSQPAVQRVGGISEAIGDGRRFKKG